MRHGEDCNNINNLRAGRGVGILTCTLNCVGVMVEVAARTMRGSLLGRQLNVGIPESITLRLLDT